MATEDAPEAPAGSPIFLAIRASYSRYRPNRESPRFLHASDPPTQPHPAWGSRVSPPRFPISIGKRGREIGDFQILWELHQTIEDDKYAASVDALERFVTTSPFSDCAAQLSRPRHISG